MGELLQDIEVVVVVVVVDPAALEDDGEFWVSLLRVLEVPFDMNSLVSNPILLIGSIVWFRKAGGLYKSPGLDLLTVRECIHFCRLIYILYCMFL